MHISEFLRRFREAMGLTQKSLADLLDVNYYRLTKWEKRNLTPKTEDAEKIKAYFLFDNFEDLTEDFLVSRIESDNWRKRGKKGKNEIAKESLPKSKSKIIKKLEGDLQSIKGAVEQLQKTLDQLKNQG